MIWEGIKDLLWYARKAMIVTASILLLLVIIPDKNWIVINLCFLIPTTIYWLVDGPKPTLKEWSWKLGTTILFLNLTLLAVLFLGAWGLLGLILLLFGLAAWRISQSWSLFDYVTTWGANTIKGNKADFKPLESVKTSVEVGKDEQEGTSENSSSGKTNSGGDSGGVKQSSELVDSAPTFQEMLQDLQTSNNNESNDRKAKDDTSNVVSDRQDFVRKVVKRGKKVKLKQVVNDGNE